MTNGAAQPLDLDVVRAQFPGLQPGSGGRALAYLDSASTAQKPRRVIEALHGVALDLLLVKGSRSMKLERVVEAFQ